MHAFYFCFSRDRSQRPSARGGRPGRSHGDGADLHGPQERRETRQNLPDHHQVSHGPAGTSGLVGLCVRQLT